MIRLNYHNRFQQSPDVTLAHFNYVDVDNLSFFSR